jgi:putative transposase
MTPAPATNLYTRHRFPAESIRRGVWLDCRLCLSDRDVEELMAERGVILTDEAVRDWGRTCGQHDAHHLRPRRPRPGDQWPLDAVFLTIHSARHDLWRAVDQDGQVLAMLVPRRRDRKAAKTCFRTRLKGLTSVPRGLCTDQWTSDGAAKREIVPRVDHRPQRDLKNRAETSHQPTRQRERRRPGCKSPGHAQRFLAAYGPMAQHVRPRRPLLPAPIDRHERSQRFQIWRDVTGVAPAASASISV